jgi:hypothetical protein
VPAGCRLKLCLKDLLSTEAWKDRAAGVKRKEKKVKKRNTTYFGRNLPTTRGDGGGGGGGGDDLSVNGSGYHAVSYLEPKKKKEFISAYTITMDVKLKDEPPAQGVSLFQARIAYVDHLGQRAAAQTGGSGDMTAAVTSSDGECVVNAAGGVGRLGAYGDVSKTKVEANRWRRVVITVQCDSKAQAQPSDIHAGGGGGGTGFGTFGSAANPRAAAAGQPAGPLTHSSLDGWAPIPCLSEV